MSKDEVIFIVVCAVILLIITGLEKFINGVLNDRNRREENNND